MTSIFDIPCSIFCGLKIPSKLHTCTAPKGLSPSPYPFKSWVLDKGE
jgi:hypothetical protein